MTTEYKIIDFVCKEVNLDSVHKARSGEFRKYIYIKRSYMFKKWRKIIFLL